MRPRQSTVSALHQSSRHAPRVGPASSTTWRGLRRANAEAKRRANLIIASGASVRKSLGRFSDPLAARMYENVLIIVSGGSSADLNDRTVGPVRRPAMIPNNSVVIPLDRRGCSRLVIHPREEAPAIEDAGSASILCDAPGVRPASPNQWHGLRALTPKLSCRAINKSARGSALHQ